MTKIRVAAVTDVGLMRKRNEDAILVGGWISQAHHGAVTTMHFDTEEPFVCAVADGIGGHQGGNLASKVALEVLADAAHRLRDGDELAAVLSEVSLRVLEFGSDPAFKGLGTTIAGVCITSGQVITFNVGDSRVYRVEGESLQQLSVDDAVVGSDGQPTNTITQALGQSGRIVPHIATERLVPARYLLCSDGVSGLQSPAQLRAAMPNAASKASVAAIAGAVREAGAHDNYSLALIDVVDVGTDAVTVERPIAHADVDDGGSQLSGGSG